MSMRSRGRGRLAVPFLAALSALASPLAAAGRPATVELAGLYATTHPKESWGEVLVRFRPSSSFLSYRGADYPAHEVSLWKRKEQALRKLRDGLFGTYTLAIVAPDPQGLLLLWYSPDEHRFNGNRILGVDPDRSLWIGPQGLPESESAEPRLLQYVQNAQAPPVPEADVPQDPNLEGIYDYYHSSTGRVLVCLRKTGEGEGKYSVTILSQVPGIGYAVVRQGLYGGSFENDSCPLVELQNLDGEHWLVWSNPAKPKQVRRNRIVCWYGNGDIGIGLEHGEEKYIENTVFQRVSGLDARIGRHAELLTLEGVYGVRLRGWASEAPQELTAAILPTNLVSDTGREKIPLFRIRTAEHDGLLPGDLFHHLGLRSEEGRCILVWYSLALQIKEELLLYDLEASGSFKLGSLRAGEPGERIPVAEFRKIGFLPGAAAAQAEGAAHAVGAAEPDGATTAARAGGDAPALEALIHDIEEASSLVIARDGTWSRRELETVLEVRRLPEELRFQEKIVLKKKEATFVLGSPQEDLIETSLRKREMRIKTFRAGKLLGGDSDPAQRAYLRRALLFNLALLFYDTLPRERKQGWRVFARWEYGLFSGDRPANVNPDGFAGEAGQRSAGMDFAAFACEFFLPPAYKDPLSLLRCRLPDRYAFFAGLFGSAPDPLRGLPCTPAFRDWVDPAEVERIEILVSTPTSATPASIAGHSLLMIKRKTDFHDGRDSLVLGFVAETSQDMRNEIHSWVYSYRGITGYYTSLIQEESLEELVRRATVLENRDVQRFRLILTEEETARLLERLWVVKNSFTYRYKFFGQNCASMLLDTLNYVFPPGERVESKVPLVAPMHGVARLFQGGRLGELIYPEYWSVGSKARRASASNRELRQEMLAILRGKTDGGNAIDRAIIAEIEELFDVLFSEGSARLHSDPLFREPVLDIDNKGRDLAYERMATLWIRLYELYVEERGILTQEEYSALAELLLRFLMNANDRELYIAIPADIKESYARSEPIPAEVSREYVEEQLRKVQLRQRNSREMQSLRLAISTLRAFAAEKAPHPGMYTVGRDLEREFAGELAVKRRKVAYTHSYYPAFLYAGYRQAPAGAGAVLGFESAIFSEELGHGSMFALQKDLGLELLRGGFEASLEPGGSIQLSGHGTAVAAKKILTRNDVDYTGWFNHGFGFTLLDNRSVLWDGEGLFPDRDSRTRAIEARYILNLFERDELRWYLDLEAGAGWVFESNAGDTAHYLGLPLALEGKLPLGGGFDNTLRCSVSWEPYLDFAGGWLSNLRGAAEIGLGLGSRTNRILYLGADLDLRFLHATGSALLAPPQLNCYLRLKLK